MKGITFQEFRPTILFLARFIGIYLAGNLLYGLYVTSFEPRPDPVTHQVSVQTGMVLTACGWPVEIRDHHRKPNTLIYYKKQPVLSVYEGCNGINTMIIFVAFLFAFGPVSRTLFWFIPAGLAIIHLANLGRISLLFFVGRYMPDKMYFVHKYLFTAILYAVIFALWVWWVRKYSIKR